jgi:hypothetical protein
MELTEQQINELGLCKICNKNLVKCMCGEYMACGICDDFYEMERTELQHDLHKLNHIKNRWKCFSLDDLDEILSCMEDSDRYISEGLKNNIIRQINEQKIALQNKDEVMRK